MAVDFVAAGTAFAGVGNLAVPWPGSQSVGDIGILLLETNQADTVSVSGWTELASSPQESAGQNHKLSVFYKVAAGSDADLTITDPGNHGIGRILVFSGVDTSSPIDSTTGSSPGTSDESVTCPSVTTTADGCAVLHIAGTGRDTNTTAQFDSWANANLVSITEVADDITGQAGGGGFGAAWGILTTAGASGTATTIQAASGVWTAVTVALKPAGGGATNTDTEAGSGSIAITGSAANGVRSLLTTAASGSIILTGSNAEGIYTPVGALTSAADSGSVVIIGASAIGRHDYLAAADSDSITITGSAANAVKSLGAVADSGSIAITGSNALAIRTRLSGAESGSVSLSGSDTNGVKATPGTGSLDEATILAIADAVWAHATAIDFADKMLICSRILRNRTTTDPVSGIMTVYADDGVTPYLTAQLYEGIDETQTYRGQGAEVRERLQ